MGRQSGKIVVAEGFVFVERRSESGKSLQREKKLTIIKSVQRKCAFLVLWCREATKVPKQEASGSWLQLNVLRDDLTVQASRGSACSFLNERRSWQI